MGQRNNLGGGTHFSNFVDAVKAIYGMTELIEEVNLGDARQVDVAVRRVGEANRIGRELAEAAHDIGCVGRGQQTHPAAREARGKTDGESIAVPANVENVAAIRQSRR